VLGVATVTGLVGVVTSFTKGEKSVESVRNLLL